MPRLTFPSTPPSLADGTATENYQDISPQPAFELPPPALCQDPATLSLTKTRASPTDAQAISPAESVYPMQAAENVKSRRRAASSAAQKSSSNQAFALPPPPTRSRKIIQMKPPRSSQDESAKGPSSASKASTSIAPKATTSTNSNANSTNAGVSKKKQPSATSAAGRKIARKTAHSLIERRRRSKMNEEFGVLTGMIPACTGEMHKLAILQASIEYIRYLEDCIAQLKEQRDISPPQPPTQPCSHPPSRRQSWQQPQFAPHYQGEPSGDVDRSGSGPRSPPFSAQEPQYQHPSISPALSPEDARQRHNSDASASTDQRRFSYSNSATTSPAFGPQSYRYGGPLSFTAPTSPALTPQREQSDLDQEATAALLMLNSDRRGTYGGSNGPSRGMSVRDLLST
ncbi:hypothetical protein SODALDRAFT_138898 [Sodiomyces alkalinus F11]|uniref:BHLH domain-containing protein n=1 Tax=Sodiomyces alkalinus (strain CBS 110278 / VKM F-3762 / F11) TaxID=1314773 RepID=A0A3N2PZP4_SODAK|nr:hypothetical protein SODALDRAFT_138898 [Sodiomyces alkalinus F11]ROT39825.1 hypothetical protein SODALDRAFT_138898 [Sodiomyces alkalinus F11]